MNFFEVRVEGLRRLNLWLEHSSFDAMCMSGASMIKFNIGLSMIGYPFVFKEGDEWMNGNLDRFISNEEFNSLEYDVIAEELYEIGLASSESLN